LAGPIRQLRCIVTDENRRDNSCRIHAQRSVFIPVFWERKLGRFGCFLPNLVVVTQIRLRNGDFLREKHPRKVKSVSDIIRKSQAKQRDAGCEKQYRNADQRTDPLPFCPIFLTYFIVHDHATPFSFGTC